MEGGSTKSGGEEDDDEEDESESKSAQSEDDDSKDGAPSGSLDDSKKKRGETDGTSSVTTKQTKAERNLFILRIAIDEKFIPSSIKNLRYAANIIFMVLLLLASKFSIVSL